MVEFLISLLVAILVLILLSITQDLIFGDRGKKGQIKEHYTALKGNDLNKTKKIDIKRLLFVQKDYEAKKYYFYVIPICFCIFILALFSFKSIFMALILSLFGIMFPRIMISNASKKRREIMNNQFKDALNSIMASLKAGLSINTALIKCAEDLERVYGPLKEKPMLEEFRKIKSDLTIGVTVEEALIGLRERVKLEDVDDFVNSIIVMRQKGGNLVEVMENVTRIITDKISIKREIDILTSGKRMESSIITFIPIFIILALSILSPSYMRPLYSSLAGQILIIFGFVLLAANYIIGKKITNIDV